MKLILCTSCQDVVKLTRGGRYCDCGRSWGRYLDDDVNAEISGDAVPIGFANSQLQFALTHRPESGMGRTFDAFVIPMQCDTVRKIDQSNGS